MRIDPKYLPSKKFSIVIIVAIVLIIIIAILSYRKENISTYKNTLVLGDFSTTTWTKTKIDTDKDGLEDWQETLYGTNRNSPDTDSDGTGDGVEIENNRNPLKANTSNSLQTPNDLLEQATIERYKNIVENNKDLSYTELLSKKIASQIVSEVETSGEVSQEKASIISKSALQNIPKINYTSKTTSSDLYFVEANEQNIKDYIRFYGLEEQNISLFLEKDIDIIEAEKINKQDINKLLALSNTIISRFKEAHLPKDSAWGLAYHLGIINDFEKMSLIIIDLLRFSSDDTALYYSSLMTYYDVRKELVSIIVTLDTTFQTDLIAKTQI
ncbi:MAG: hypothetical protein WC827_02820 [Candidatus Paceibacterota bacterium]|jgi:hypothetical protein